MSYHEVYNAISALRLEDERLETPGNCRYSASKMMRIATRADVTRPLTHKSFVVYGPPSGEQAHYAFRADGIVFNITPENGFPQYIGEFREAPGKIPQMRSIDHIE